MLTALLAMLAMGLIGLVLLVVMMALVGMAISAAFGLVGFLLFKVGPLLLIGWAVTKLLQRTGARARHRRLSAPDQRWLDGR